MWTNASTLYSTIISGGCLRNCNCNAAIKCYCKKILLENMHGNGYNYFHQINTK
jgi:hypothetical protein